FQAQDGIRDRNVTGVQTCALPILDRGRAFIIVAGEPWYTDSQTHRVPGDGQVSEYAGDVVTQSAGLAAAAADRVVFDRLAVDPGEVLVDRGVGDRQTEFDRPADRVGNKVRRLQNGSCGGRRRRREPSSSHRRTRLHVVVPAHPPITALRTPEPEEPLYPQGAHRFRSDGRADRGEDRWPAPDHRPSRISPYRGRVGCAGPGRTRQARRRPARLRPSRGHTA